MSRFVLIANYDNQNIEYAEYGDVIKVEVPMLSNGNLRYGLETVKKKLNDIKIFPTEIGFDVMSLATMVYLADTRICRDTHGQDSWTREITLQIPVSNVVLWDKQIEILQRMLKFLTGDLWKIEFYKRDLIFDTNNDCEKNNHYEKASLFSGGMDSLISTINILESKQIVLLMGHAGEGITKNAQTNIIKELDKKYPDSQHSFIDLWMAFESNYIPHGGDDNNTRSRSFLFIGFAVFSLSGTKIKELLVPENGLIALNVPLDVTRVGSYSTRTTHPFYLYQWNELLKGLGLEIQVFNPYWNKTKGEMANECLNKDFLFDAMQLSVSCSSIAKSRWKGLPPQHCGYCVPCLIRRAAMHKAFGNDCTTYTADSIDDINEEETYKIQLKSFQYAIAKIKNHPGVEHLYIHKTGPLYSDESYLKQLADTYRRGLLEVDSFIEKLGDKQ